MLNPLLRVAFISILFFYCSGKTDHDSYLFPKSSNLSALLEKDKFFQIPQSNIETSCRAFIEKFADVAAEFTRCSIVNSRPIKFCEHCMNEYVTAKSVYNIIMKVS